MASLADKLSSRLLRGPESEPIILNRRRIYILPTANGYMFAVLLIIMLIGSINYNNSMGFALTFLMGSVVMVSMIHTHRNLSGLNIQSASTKSVFCGDTAHFTLHLSNEFNITKYVIDLDAGDSKSTATCIEPATTISVTLAKQSQTRGKLHAGRIRISTAYPIGMFRAWSWIETSANCTVYPSPEKNAPDPQFESGSGISDKSNHTRREDFYGIRTYRPGDPLKSIAWKQSARERGLFSKEFSGGGSQTLWLDWDIDEVSSLEHKLSRLTRWVLECERRGINYGLDIPGHKIPPGQGHKHQHLCLSALAFFNQ